MFAGISNGLVNGVALATAAVISIAHPTSAHAQLRVEIAPALGAYVPGRELPYPDIARCLLKAGGDPRYWNCGRVPSYTQTRAPAVGGRVTAFPWNRRTIGGLFGIEGSFWYVPSSVGPTPGFFSVLDEADKVIVAGLRAVVRFPPKASIISGVLMGGPALIHHSGAYYAGLNGTSSVGTALGAGLDLRPGRGFALRAEIAAYLYKGVHVEHQLTPDQQSAQEFGQLYAASGTFPQKDFVLSLSISPFGRPGERQR
jgi:hypothetical protein